MSQHCSVSKRLLSGALPDENHLDGCVLSSRTLKRSPPCLEQRASASTWRSSGGCLGRQMLLFPAGLPAPRAGGGSRSGVSADGSTPASAHVLPGPQG